MVNPACSADCVAHTGCFDYLEAFDEELGVAVDFVIQSKAVVKLLFQHGDDLAAGQLNLLRPWRNFKHLSLL